MEEAVLLCYEMKFKCILAILYITLEDNNGNKKLLKRTYEAKIDAVAAMMDALVAYKLNKDAFE